MFFAVLLLGEVNEQLSMGDFDIFTTFLTFKNIHIQQIIITGQTIYFLSKAVRLHGDVLLDPRASLEVHDTFI